MKFFSRLRRRSQSHFFSFTDLRQLATAVVKDIPKRNTKLYREETLLHSFYLLADCPTIHCCINFPSRQLFIVWRLRYQTIQSSYHHISFIFVYFNRIIILRLFVIYKFYLFSVIFLYCK